MRVENCNMKGMVKKKNMKKEDVDEKKKKQRRKCMEQNVRKDLVIREKEKLGIRLVKDLEKKKMIENGEGEFQNIKRNMG